MKIRFLMVTREKSGMLQPYLNIPARLRYRKVLEPVVVHFLIKKWYNFY
jgi:hypothetical protein